ncbi:hypothetical protein BACFIN_05723 [Bacteroides finegoldii DSM 17565]|nr:hypothetical protein BACFIN_05723 [Bacteroides finegoldii DSM 17565]
MYFVQNHALLVLVQESDRVVFGKAPHVEVLQGVIRQVREQVSDQGCLAGLAGAGDGYDREITVRLFYHGGQFPTDIFCFHIRLCNFEIQLQNYINHVAVQIFRDVFLCPVPLFPVLSSFLPLSPSGRLSLFTGKGWIKRIGAKPHFIRITKTDYCMVGFLSGFGPGCFRFIRYPP